jgi:hypothetical protein
MRIFDFICVECKYEWMGMYLTRECPNCKKVGFVAIKQKEDKDE